MAEIFLAGKSDFREVTDFINMVFDKKFPEFMEKVYTEENFMRAEHYCIKDEGKLAACVAVYPQTITFGDNINLCAGTSVNHVDSDGRAASDICVSGADKAENSITCAWIGSVSVDPDKRGRGYMKQLMSHVHKVLSDRRIPFVYLSGRRNRYGFYGYEITGIRNWFIFEEENVRLTKGFDACKNYTFTPLYRDVKNSDSERERKIVSDRKTGAEVNGDLAKVIELYKKRLVTVRSEEDIVEAMKTWYYKPYIINKGGEFAGYMLIKDGDVAELELINFDNIIEICGAIMLCFGLESVRIEAREWEREKCKALGKVCERYTVETLGNMKIFDYAGTLRFMMELENGIRTLKRGRLTVHVSMEETFFIEVTETGINTGLADHEEADLFLTHSQLVRLMFTKGSSFATDSDNELVRDWFPLSYTPERVDEF